MIHCGNRPANKTTRIDVGPTSILRLRRRQDVGPRSTLVVFLLGESVRVLQNDVTEFPVVKVANIPYLLFVGFPNNLNQRNKH